MIATPDARNRELAAIHCAKRDLALDDATYRDMLWAVARVRSARDLDQAGRHAVIEHMRKRGFKPPLKPAPPRVGRPSVPAEREPLVRKLEALLFDASRPWAYAAAMAKRMFHVDELAWCTADQLRRLVAALEYDKRRRARRR